jgi:hypothetical protein
LIYIAPLLLLMLLPDRLLRERIRKSRSAQALDHLEEWDMWEGQDLVPLDRWAGSLQESLQESGSLQESSSLQKSSSWQENTLQDGDRQWPGHYCLLPQ